MIKLFVSDIDGTLTDGTVFYSERGEELKQFSHRDGRGFYLLHQKGIECALITSESAGINLKRFQKFEKLGTVKYFVGGVETKAETVKQLCEELNIKLYEVAMIGDDTNDSDALEIVGIAACPEDSNYKVKEIENIVIMKSRGGQGAVREFVDFLIKTNNI
jgi:YrbI family 3-deoxy-D-manno-octulosonate 8-phosphate phosphatase